MSAFASEIQAVKDGSTRKGTLGAALVAFKKAVDASPDKATDRQKDIAGIIKDGMAMFEMLTLQMAVVDSGNHSEGGRRRKKTQRRRKHF